jgi:type II secretory pathway pseudopilin PulG
LFAVSTVGLALTACNSGQSSATATSTSPAAPSSSSPVSQVDQAKQAALTAYQGMWHDFVVAGTTSDWQSDTLGQHATDPARTNMRRSLLADHNNGLVTKGEPTFTPTVTTADPPGNPTRIVIKDCSDGTHWLKYKSANGQLANDTPGGRHLINAIVEKQSDGSWKVSEYGVHEVGTC